MKVVFLILATLSNALLAEDFVCPNGPITEQVGLTGVLPEGATSQVKVPQNTDCTYQFHIPKGYALKIETSAVYDTSNGDFVMFDTFYISSGADKQVEYAINNPLKYEVKSATGNLTFFAKYSYIDISNYQQKVIPTGNFFNTTLEANTYYTMQASEGDTATFKLAMLNTGFYDSSLYEVFVFDGNDFMNSDYIGRLSEQLKFFNMHSDSRSFTFLNLYRTPSYSYLLGNDYSKVKDYGQYLIGVVDPVKLTTGYLGNDVNGQPDAYYTWFCDGCDGFYIEYLEFDEKRWNDTEGYVEIRGLSPTQGLAPVLKYMYSLNNNASFPQYIPVPMASFYIHKAAAQIGFKKDSTSSFLNTLPSDKRSVSSANLWNPDASQNFNYKFQDPVSLSAYNFSINLKNVNLENDDELDVQVGSVNGLTTLDKKYTKTSLSNVAISGMGRYLQLTYSAKSKNSKVELDFEMIDPSATTAVPKSTAATSPATVVSTTVGSSVSTASVPITMSTAPSTVSHSSSAATLPTVSTSNSPSTTAVSSSTLPPSTMSQSTSTATLSTVSATNSISTSAVSSSTPPTSTSTISQSTSISQKTVGTTATVQTTTSGASVNSFLMILVGILLY